MSRDPRMTKVIANNGSMNCVYVQIRVLGLAVCTCLLVLNGCCEASSGSGAPDYMDLEGSGGSGEDSNDGEVECSLPPSRASPPDVQEDDLLTEIRCHLACIEWVAEAENITLQVSSAQMIWPTVSVQTLERDCSVYQRIQECRVGCASYERARGAGVARCGGICSRNCKKSCNQQLVCEQTESTCQRKCSRFTCDDGCMLYQDEVVTAQNDSLVPISPPNKPHLHVPEVMIGTGRYLVDPGNTSSQSVDAFIDVKSTLLTSFVFRVVHAASNVIAYYWLRTLEETLNLEAFACKDDVLLQYAAVNKHGMSDWSRSNYIDVYGDAALPIPENPDMNFIHFWVSKDERFGFWKHAVVQVTWNTPTRGFQFLSHFEVVVESRSVSCGRNKREIVSSDKTTAVIKASVPTDGPVNDCTYDITITSIARSGLETNTGEKNSVHINVNNAVPLNFTCDRMWNDMSGTFQFSLSWTLPNSSYLMEAIRKFVVVVKSVTAERIEFLSADYVTFEQGVLSYSFLTDAVSSKTDGSYFSIEMSSHAESNLYHTLTPEPRHCEFDAMPFPPNAPSSVNINHDRMRFESIDVGTDLGTVVVDLRWTRPPRGNISNYELRVVEFEATLERVDIGEVFYMEAFESSQLSASIVAQVPLSSNNGCVYLQVRSISTHGAISNWSTPVCLAIGELPLPTEPLDMTTTEDRHGNTHSTQEPRSENSKGLSKEVFFIVIGLGAIMFGATVILALFVCLACAQNMRATSRAKILKSQPSLRKTISPLATPSKQPSSFQTPKPHFQGGNSYSNTSLTKSSSEWELHPAQIVVEDKLGHGVFGDVFSGTIRGGIGLYKSNGPHSMTVAIKLLKSAASEDERTAFLGHIEQAKLVTTKNLNEHVVKMVGCVSAHEPVCLVTELPDRGDLLSYLDSWRRDIGKIKTRAEIQEEQPSLTGRQLQPSHLIAITVQVATGMEYLASVGVVHGDIACRNMYLTSNHQIKISDFGLSPRKRNKPKIYMRTPNGRLPLRWMSIEAIAEGGFSTASDVWAFGVLLWEIVTLGGFPYHDISHKDLLNSLLEGHRLEQPNNCSQKIYDIMMHCWNEDSLDRPSFTHLRETLQEKQTRDDIQELVSLDINFDKAYYHVRVKETTNNSRQPSSGQVSKEDNITDWSKNNTIGSIVLQQTHCENLPRIVEDELGEEMEEQQHQYFETTDQETDREEETMDLTTTAVTSQQDDDTTEGAGDSSTTSTTSECTGTTTVSSSDVPSPIPVPPSPIPVPECENRIKLEVISQRDSGVSSDEMTEL